LRSDLLDRGIPWFRLMLRDRTMPSDLNVTAAHRFSVVLVFAVAVLGAAFFMRRSPLLLLLFAIAAGLLVYLNLDLYRFFARKRGLRFAVQAIPLHWLYYGYCGVAVGAGLSLHLWEKLRPQRRLSQPWPRTR
jgi:hypothetical protein